MINHYLWIDIQHHRTVNICIICFAINCGRNSIDSDKFSMKEQRIDTSIVNEDVPEHEDDYDNIIPIEETQRNSLPTPGPLFQQPIFLFQ
ncbi:DNA replication and repair protein RecF [Dirofilaria immitis]